MLKKTFQVIPAAFYVALFWWWASFGYPTEAPICNPPGSAENCESHNILFALAVTALDKLNFYSALVTAIATGAIAGFTYTLWTSTRDQLIHNRRVERAYVKLSGVAPGITPDRSGHFWITVSTKNFGRTPATISDTLLNHLVLPHGDPLPENPPYERQMAHIPGAFLVADEEIFTQVVYRITEEQMADVTGFLSDLYLIGYVDYRDQFGGRHRAGYARVYRPAIDDRATYRTDVEFAARSNLVFVAPEGYNYDRPRTRSEGIDWDQTA